MVNAGVNPKSIDPDVITKYFNGIRQINSMERVEDEIEKADAVANAVVKVIIDTRITEEHLKHAISYARYLGLDGEFEGPLIPIAERKLDAMKKKNEFNAEEELKKKNIITNEELINAKKELSSLGGKKRKPKRRKYRTKRKKSLKKKSLKRKRTRRR